MVVPDLVVDEQLNKPNAPFHQTPCVKAATTVGIRRFLPNAIEIVYGFGFLT